MTAEFLTAVAASALIGTLAIRPSRYAFWLAWVKRRLYVVLALYVLVNGAFGALGASLADLLGWNPSSSWLMSGVTFAVVGQALLRVEPRGFGLGQTSSARSILASSAGYLLEALADACEREIQARLSAFTSPELYRQADYLYERYCEKDDEIPRETKDVIRTELTEAGERLEKNPDAEGPRGSLEWFCMRQFADRELLPTRLRTG